MSGPERSEWPLYLVEYNVNFRGADRQVVGLRLGRRRSRWPNFSLT